MKIDLYDSTGKKGGTLDMPAQLFEAPIKRELMHRFLILQQANRRRPIAHAKTRGEKRGSTAKMFAQKGTGRARRGPVRSPLLRGGGRTFGPKKWQNFSKAMPQAQRRAALFSCLSLQAKDGKIIGLTEYGEDAKTKTFATLLGKLPVPVGRKIVFVLPEKMEALERASRNIPGVKTIRANYLNPEDILGAHALVFVGNAVQVAEETFTKKTSTTPAS